MPPCRLSQQEAELQARLRQQVREVEAAAFAHRQRILREEERLTQQRQALQEQEQSQKAALQVGPQALCRCCIAAPQCQQLD